MTDRAAEDHPERGAPGSMTLEAFLTRARRRGASDLHVGAGKPVMLRKDGRLVVIGREKLDAKRAEELLLQSLTDPQVKRLRKQLTIEMRLNRPEGRYRVCIISHRLGWDGCFHIIPSEIPTPRELGLTEHVERLTHYRNGLVLISGPRGSGRTTTLASLISLVNETRADHIITAEDPVEFDIPSKRSIVSQRTVKVHTESFANAVRASLREDPDVIAVGDLRDQDTVGMAVTAAETGHLVLACLNTASATGSVTRIIDSFPPDQHAQVRTMLSESLRGVITQRLLPRKDGKGRVLALEVLINTSGVASLIRENRLFQVATAMQTGKRHGMIPMDESLGRLVREGLIERELALSLANNPERVAAATANPS